MKIIKVFFLINLFVLYSFANYAQVSGFLGKKNIISGGLFLKSSYLLANKNGNHGYFVFNDHYSIEYERVIRRKNSIKLHITTFESMYNLYGNDFKSYTSFNLNKFSTKAFGADYVIYKKINIAPLGSYFSFGFDAMFNNINVDTAVLHNDIGMTSGLILMNTTVTNSFSLGFNFKTGVKYIYLNCLSFDFNFHCGILASSLYNIYADKAIDYKADYVQKQIEDRLWGHYLWGLNFSIGYIF